MSITEYITEFAEPFYYREKTTKDSFFGLTKNSDGSVQSRFEDLDIIASFLDIKSLSTVGITNKTLFYSGNRVAVAVACHLNRTHCNNYFTVGPDEPSSHYFELIRMMMIYTSPISLSFLAMDDDMHFYRGWTDLKITSGLIALSNNDKILLESDSLLPYMPPLDEEEDEETISESIGASRFNIKDRSFLEDTATIGGHNRDEDAAVFCRARDAEYLSFIQTLHPCIFIDHNPDLVRSCLNISLGDIQYEIWIYIRKWWNEAYGQPLLAIFFNQELLIIKSNTVFTLNKDGTFNEHSKLSTISHGRAIAFFNGTIVVSGDNYIVEIFNSSNMTWQVHSHTLQQPLDRRNTSNFMFVYNDELYLTTSNRKFIVQKYNKTTNEWDQYYELDLVGTTSCALIGDLLFLDNHDGQWFSDITLLNLKTKEKIGSQSVECADFSKLIVRATPKKKIEWSDIEMKKKPF